MGNPVAVGQQSSSPPSRNSNPPKGKQDKHFWNFVPAKGDSAPELILYGDISQTSWYGDEITPQMFNRELQALGDVPEIVVRINSGGGDVYAAQGIYTRLKDHPAQIIVKIDGWAGSAATVIAMAGDKIMIPASGNFMVHDPTLGIIGYFGVSDFEKFIECLQTAKQSIINAYALKTGMDQADISAMMAAETWLTGDQAVEKGFCDEVMFGAVDTVMQDKTCMLVNSVRVDLSGFAHVPENLLNSPPQNSGGSLYKNPEERNEEEMKINGSEMEIKTADDLRAAFPDFVRQIEDSAAERGAGEERTRIKEIRDMAVPGMEPLAEKAMFEDPQNAAEFAKTILSQHKQMIAGAAYLKGREADADASGVQSVGAQSQEGTATKENPWGEIINQVYPEMK